MYFLEGLFLLFLSFVKWSLNQDEEMHPFDELLNGLIGVDIETADKSLL